MRRAPRGAGSSPSAVQKLIVHRPANQIWRIEESGGPAAGELTALLKSDTAVPSVTQAPLRPEIAAIAVPATTGGRNMAGDDFAVTAGWGHYGQGDAVMPGQGCVDEREYAPEGRAALSQSQTTLGKMTFDIYLNGEAF